jgi:6-phosphogluconate dehydrogenase
MQIGFLGLGKMGKGLVLRLLEKKHQVVAWNRSPDDLESVTSAGAVGATSIGDLVAKVTAPRTIWIMVKAGEAVDDILKQLTPHLTKGDLVIDGGNSLYKDTLRRAEELKRSSIEYMDIGVSGGPSGARGGACLMIGGSNESYTKVEPALRDIAAPNAMAHLGPVGAGHFAKMVHNGIEYGMMQAIAEGAAVLKASPFGYDLAKVFELYNHRSVIESRLVGWTTEALVEDGELSDTSSIISATGEGEWTVQAAKELGIPVPIIEESFNVRTRSSKEPESFRNKVVSAMRGKFGGHEVKKK